MTLRDPLPQSFLNDWEYLCLLAAFDPELGCSRDTIVKSFWPEETRPAVLTRVLNAILRSALKKIRSRWFYEDTLIRWLINNGYDNIRSVGLSLEKWSKGRDPKATKAREECFNAEKAEVARQSFVYIHGTWWRPKGCPKCVGDLFLERDSALGPYWNCLQCGNNVDIEKTDFLTQEARLQEERDLASSIG